MPALALATTLPAPTPPQMLPSWNGWGPLEVGTVRRGGRWSARGPEAAKVPHGAKDRGPAQDQADREKELQLARLLAQHDEARRGGLLGYPHIGELCARQQVT
jgi:hypothetical protein